MQIHQSKPVLAYAVAFSSPALEREVRCLYDYCERTDNQVDLYAEEADRNNDSRPLWSEILKKIENHETNLLVVPSLGSLVGGNGDAETLKQVLYFLSYNKVELLTLKDRVDTTMMKTDAILARFKRLKAFYPAAPSVTEHAELI